MPDLVGKTDDELDMLIQNHERLGRTSDPKYADLIRERNRRRDHEFELENTEAFLSDRARQDRFVSYGEIANHYGLDWSAQVRSNIIRHLDEVNRWSHSRHGILLSAIVVNACGQQTGEMADETLRGFTEKATALGYKQIDDPREFLKAEQRRVFSWAKQRGEG